MSDVEIGREEAHEGGSKKEDSPVAEESDLQGHQEVRDRN